jgi:hypothetical protein
LKDGVDNCSSKLKLIDEDGIETVADEQLKDGVDNCSSKLKLTDEVKNVEEPKEGMQFCSIENFMSIIGVMQSKRVLVWYRRRRKRIKMQMYIT